MASAIILLYTGIIDRHTEAVAVATVISPPRLGGYARGVAVVDRNEPLYRLREGRIDGGVVRCGRGRRSRREGVRGEISLECLWSEHVTFIELWAYPRRATISRVFVSPDCSSATVLTPPSSSWLLRRPSHLLDDINTKRAYSRGNPSRTDRV